jgi:hypothetical protein
MSLRPFLSARVRDLSPSLASASRATRWLATASLLIATSCLSGDRTSPSEPEVSLRLPESLISDGAHSNGTPGFFFLPPLVSRPQATGDLDTDVAFVNPIIAICDVTDRPDVACGAPGGTAAVRTFTLTSDPAITIDGDKYTVNWDTGDEGFVAGHLYRVHVFAGPGRRDLGFADVLLTTKPGQVKNHDGEIVALNDGRTLPIHFRIEQGVVPREAPARSFELTGLPPSLLSGATASVTVTAHDQNGGVATSYRGTVVFSSSNSTATLPAQYTFTEADAGTHTFTDAISFVTPGAATVRVTDAADASIFGEAPLIVLPLNAVLLQVTGLIGPLEAGTVSSITVTARDVNGNVATGYTGTIAFTSNDPQADLPASYTFTAADAGTHAFPASVTLRTAGSVTVTATDQVDNTITGAQAVDVTPAAAAQLALSGVPPNTTAGAPHDLTVIAQDAFGNTATGYTGTVQFSSSDPNAILPADYTFQPGDAGVHSFAGGVTFTTAGTQTLQATDAANASIADNLETTVAPAAVAELRFTTQPTNTLAGETISLVVVTAYDAFGNVATNFTGQIRVGIGTNPTGAILFGTFQVRPVLGVATYNDLIIVDAGSGYTLAASVVLQPGEPGATSEAFDITAAAPE